MDALVFAGGRGTRLQPLTFSLPKPLLPVRDTPIIEIILRQLRRRGFTRVFVSVGHKGHLVRAFLTQLDLEGIEVQFLDEREPLGTAGPLRLLPPDVERFFVINGDILSNVDFRAVLDEHAAQDRAYMTAVVHHHAVVLPYGVIGLDGEQITGIDEKPTLNIPVAAGMYAFDRRVLEVVPPGRVDMPDVIKRLAVDGRVRAHITKEDWTDIADLADYEKVNLDNFVWDDR